MEALLSPGGVIATIGVISAGIAMALFGVVRTLRESVADLRGRVDDLEKERDGLKIRLAERDAAHMATERDLEAVKKVVTGETHWVSIETQLQELHRQITATLATILDIVKDLARRWGSG